MTDGFLVDLCSLVQDDILFESSLVSFFPTSFLKSAIVFCVSNMIKCHALMHRAITVGEIEL